MKILIIKPHQHPYEADVPSTLESLQGVVGGYLETVYPWDDQVAIVCDEDGRIKGKEPNRMVAPGVVITGTFFICGLGYNGFTDLPEEMAHKYSELLYNPQAFVHTPHGLKVLKESSVLEPVNPEKAGRVQETGWVQGISHNAALTHVHETTQDAEHVTEHRSKHTTERDIDCDVTQATVPDIYQKKGYTDRDDYLGCLADDYDVPLEVVYAVADLLGPSEDFDGLVSSLEDASLQDW